MRSSHSSVALGAIARREFDGAVSADAHREGCARLLATVAVRSPPRSAPAVLARLAAVAAVGAIAAALVLGYVRFSRGGPETRTEGTAALEAAPALEVIEVSALEAERRIDAAGGTVVVLSRETTASVRRTKADLGGVDLRQGSASVIRPRGAALSFAIRCGALSVVVDGDSEVRVSALADGARVVNVRHGTSTVSSERQSIRLRAGESMHAHETNGLVQFDGEQGEHASSTSPPSASPVEPSPRSTKRGWSDRVRAGEYAHVIAEAEESGVDRVLQAAPLPQLAALADAARYVHRNDLATRTLLAQRARFRDSLEAQNAAFFLGRLAEDASTLERAQRWYDVYLREAPRGAFVPEAYGRRLALVSKHASTKGAARPMATDYLSRYPNGAYADLARELLSQP